MRHNLIAFRPRLLHIDDQKASSRGESFQNETLRPIIKLQSEILIQFTLNYFKKYKKKDLAQIDPYYRRDLIRDAFRNDGKYRSLIIGMIVGLFSTAELEDYFGQKSEIDKRISTIVSKRLTDLLALKEPAKAN